MTLLLLEGLTKHFGAMPALDGFDLAVEAGRRTAIVGPSGSGKTTLLRLIAGFETPDAGRITLGDAVLAQAGWAMPAHRRPIGLVSQDGALFPHLDIRDNIGFGLDWKLPGRDRRIDELMDLVELGRALLDRRPHQLSGGQQQRVALARALARRPRLMLLDEPFSALDAGLRDSLRRKVMDILHGQGVASILVTHDQEEALIYADQLAVLRDGRLQQAGSPRQLYLEPKDAATAAFLGAAILIDARIEPGGWADSALGRFRVEGAGDATVGTLLIRPEQIELRPADPRPSGNSDRDPPVAQVMKLEFAGPLCRLRLDLDTPSDTLSSLTVQVPSTRAPGLGDRVAIALLGAPHILRG